MSHASPANSWLTSLELVAVQPACLRAHPDHQLQQPEQQPADHAQPIQQQQLQQQQPPEDLQHHELLLQLQATLTSHAPAARRPPPAGGQLEVSTITAGATVSSSSLLPLPVNQAVLQVVLLNRHMQVLLHKQYNFIQLLQEFLDSSSRPPAQPDTGTSSSSSSSSRQQPDYGEHTLHCNLQLSAPCQPSAHVLDALHLFVTMCSAELSDPSLDTEGQQAACLVAELPLLVMPAQAQQEVQHQLLPAMRQDVQNDQQQRQEQQGQHLQMGAADIALHAAQVEQAVWQHFNQLALDILLIMQLSEAVRSEAAQAARVASSAAGSQPDNQHFSTSGAAVTSAEAAAGIMGPPSSPSLSSQQEQPGNSGAAFGGMGSPSAMDNLLQAVNTLLLPLLLPFMTAHGMHNTLQVLLQCLPPQLQLQQHWQQQQLARLEALAALPQLPPQHQEQPGLPANPGAAAAAAAENAVVVSSAMLDTPAAPPPGAAGTAAPAAAEYAMSSQSESVYGSGRSSPAEDGESWVPEQQLQQQCTVALGSTSRQSQASSCRPDASQQQGMQQQAGSSQPLTGVGEAGVRRRSGWEGNDVTHGPQRPADHPLWHDGSIQGAAVGAERGSGSRDAQPSSAGGAAGGAGGGEDGRHGRRRSFAARYQRGVLTGATGMPCWLVPFKQFADSSMERRYLAWKHEQLLYVDVLGGLYTLAIALSLTKPTLFQHPATWVLLVMTLLKALPHVPLLLGYRQEHIRYRELWMFLAAPCIGLLLCFLVLATNAWQPSTMPPMPLAYRSFWRMHGELITATLRAFFQHMRLRPFIIYTLVDRVVSMQIWAPWSGVLTAVGRSALAGAVSVVVCWALELCFRRRFVLVGFYRPEQPQPGPVRSTLVAGGQSEEGAAASGTG